MASAAGRFPFDTACRDNTALELLRVLVERTPVTVKMTDDGEELPLPLHFACNRQASVEMMVKFLLGIDPDAVKTANSHGNLPLHLVCCNHARSHEPLDVVQFLAKENPTINTLSAHSKFPKRNRGLGVGRLHVSITKRGPSRERSGFPLAWNKHGESSVHDEYSRF
jgi:hypothetical protein